MMGQLSAGLYVESTEPRIILERLLEASVPAQVRNMRANCRAKPETLHANPLMGCGADYVFHINGSPVLGIERKTPRDAYLGLVPRPNRARISIFRQLDKMKVFPIRALLMEGPYAPDLLVHEPKLLGVQYWCMRNGIFVFHTSGIGGTVSALRVIYHRLRTAEPFYNPVAFDQEL